MRVYLKHIILLGVLLIVPLFTLWAGNEVEYVLNQGKDSVSVDTILSRVMEHAPYYANIIKEYNSELYVKGRVYVRKKNELIRLIPSMFRPKRGVKEYIVESYSDLHYTAPDIYDQKIKALYGTTNKLGGFGGNVFEYFYVNVYSPFLLRSKLLSPLSPSGKKYYDYRIDSILNGREQKSYRITFTPCNKSYQLVEGYMTVTEGNWSIREMQFTGNSEYLTFDNHIHLGEINTDTEFLPVEYNINATFHLLGNVIDGSYMAMLDYKTIEHNDEEELFALRERKSYDLTHAYKLQTDTTRYYRDSVSFNKLRPLPLTTDEQNIYKNHYARIDTTLDKTVVKKTKTEHFWGTVGDMLISDYSVNLMNIGTVKCSPLINPFLVSYSGKEGFSYRQEFRYNRLFSGDRHLRIVPKVGYNFKFDELYWTIRGDYEYWPRKRSSLHLRMGNGNRIYTSEVLDEIKEMPDTVFDFNKLHLDYYRDFNIDLRHRVEIVNGLKLDIGFMGHRRNAVQKSDFSYLDPPTEEEEELRGKLKNRYVTCAPRVVLSWTPGQYYYMSGLRKINLHSKYPTFTLDWERGIKGFLGGNGGYERVEIDMQHKVSLGVMRTLYYRAGGGTFTDQDQVYFVDFVNFSKSSLPSGWNDDIGGAFQELDRRWYNSSRKYLRSNVTYEAPFLLLPRLLRYTRNVLNERVYLGVLAMPHLNPYIEVGYGIGTHIFDFGVFAGNVNGKFEGVGFKLTFEIFNR